jgi:hypothetical protein
VIRGGQAQLIPTQGIHRGFAEQIASKIPIVVLERTVGVIAFGGKQGPHPIRRRRQHHEISLSAELSSCALHHSILHRVAGCEIHGAGRGEVAELRQVGAFVDIQPLDGFGDDEIQVGIPLSVGMTAQVDRHAVGKEGDIGAVIRVESA